MPVADRNLPLVRHLVGAWLRTDADERLPAEVYPAYADKLEALINRLALWGEREDKVPTQAEFASILDDLRFLVAQADPHYRSRIYTRAGESLRAAEAAARDALQ